MRAPLAILLLLVSVLVGPVWAQVARSPTAEAIGLEVRSDGTVRASFLETDLRQVLRAFAEIGGFQLVLDPAVEGRVTAEFDGVTRKAALKSILRTHELAVDGGCSRPIAGSSDGAASARPRPVLIVRPLAR